MVRYFDTRTSNLRRHAPRLIFKGELLVQVVADISRYTNESFIITDEKIRHIPSGWVSARWQQAR